MMIGETIRTDALDPQLPVAELVNQRPGRARLFERLHIDYCCGGEQTLADACATAGVQLDATLAALQTLDELGSSSGDNELRDWRAAETLELCEHIVARHHAWLRGAFPRIATLVGTVVRVHGAGDATLSEVQRVFERIRESMAPHLDVEEAELFPVIVAAELNGRPLDEALLAEHEREHAEVGRGLAELRVLCHGYERERAHCNTHRAMLDALEEMERDLHQHVHEENNILFPRARAQLSGQRIATAER